MPLRPPDFCRNALLDAAEAVVHRDGLGTLTLDAVAAQAGVSKGGLLHHFPSKDRLLEALVRKIVGAWRDDVMRAVAVAPEGPGRLSRALLTLCLEDQACRNETMRRTSLVLITALINSDELVRPLRDLRTEMLALAAADRLPPGVAEVVLLAVDGLWYEWMFGLSDLTPDRAERIRNTLASLIRVKPTPRKRAKVAKSKTARRGRPGSGARPGSRKAGR